MLDLIQKDQNIVIDDFSRRTSKHACISGSIHLKTEKTKVSTNSSMKTEDGPFIYCQYTVGIPEVSAYLHLFYFLLETIDPFG